MRHNDTEIMKQAQQGTLLVRIGDRVSISNIVLTELLTF